MGNTYLRSEDVRELLQLIGEVRELGAEPRQWREHMLSALGRLCGAHVAVADEGWISCQHTSREEFKRIWGLAEEHAHQVPVPVSPVRAIILQMIDVGFSSPAQRTAFHEFCFAANYDNDPSFPAIVKAAMSPTTATRQEFVSDRDWYQSSHVNEQRRQMDLDHFVYSSQRIAVVGCFTLIGLHRPFGDKPFTDREVALVHVFHETLSSLWSNSRVLSPSRFLPSRLRETLHHLMAGMSEKEIADVLSLSHQTVHDYVKAIYRRYGVVVVEVSFT